MTELTPVGVTIRGIRHRHVRTDGSAFTHSHDENMHDYARLSKDDALQDHENDFREDDGDPTEKDEKAFSLVRFLMCRVGLRVAFVASVVIFITFVPLPFDEWFDDFKHFVETLRDENLALSIALYTAFSVLFSTFAPTGYAPTIAGGMIFPLYIAIPISYVGVNLGATLNLLCVRAGCCRSCVDGILKRAVGKFQGLDLMLTAEPVRTVFIMRFPFMYNGLLNYIFAMSSVDLPSYVIGNALGFLPGCAVFSTLGDKMKSLTQVLTSGGGSVEEILLLAGVLCAVLLSIVLFRLLSKRVAAHMESHVAPVARRGSEESGTERPAKEEGDPLGLGSFENDGT